jgi:hypothetical protein
MLLSVNYGIHAWIHSHLQKDLEEDGGNLLPDDKLWEPEYVPKPKKSRAKKAKEDGEIEVTGG